MIILGIDPGLATIGYGVIQSERGKLTIIDYGVISTSKDLSLSNRLVTIDEDINKLLEIYSPDEIAIEELFFNKNVTNAIMVAQARGVIVASCMKKVGKVFEYTPLQIKQALTGYGRADKNQIQQMVASILALKFIPKPDDAADALAVAICHSNTNNFSGMFRT